MELSVAERKSILTDDETGTRNGLASDGRRTLCKPHTVYDSGSNSKKKRVETKMSTESRHRKRKGKGSREKFGRNEPKSSPQSCHIHQHQLQHTAHINKERKNTTRLFPLLVSCRFRSFLSFFISFHPPFTFPCPISILFLSIPLLCLFSQLSSSLSLTQKCASHNQTSINPFLPPSLPPFLHFLLIVENRGLPWLGSLLLVGRTRGGGIRRVMEGELDQAWRKGGRRQVGMCTS